jgi:hypothetical protein
MMMAGRDLSSNATNTKKGYTEEEKPGRLRQPKHVTACLGNSNHGQEQRRGREDDAS